MVEDLIWDLPITAWESFFILNCIVGQMLNQWSCTSMYRLMWNSRHRQSCENSVHVSVGNKEVMSSVQYDYVSVRSAEDLPVNWVNSGSTTETQTQLLLILEEWMICWISDQWRMELPGTTSANRAYPIIFLEGWRGAVSLLIEHWHRSLLPGPPYSGLTNLRSAAGWAVKLINV